MENPGVTITILAFKSKEFIENCVQSAINLNYDGLIEIKILEQGGDDDEFQLLEKLRDELEKPPQKTITVKRIKRNLGFAAGHNFLIEQSKSDFVLCLNADAALHPDFLFYGTKAFDDPKVGAVQAKLLRQNIKTGQNLLGITGKPIIDTTGLLPLKNRRIINRGQGQEDRGQFEMRQEIFGADGAAPLYLRKALEDSALTIHGNKEYFDENFFSYKEDVDLAWRMRLLGWKAIYEPKAIAFHGRGSGDSAAHSAFEIIKERKKISPLAKYYSFSNQHLMLIKNETLRGLTFAFWPWMIKEAGALLFALLTEHRTIPAIWRVLKLTPKMLKKRKMIQKRKVQNTNPYYWFK